MRSLSGGNQQKVAIAKWLSRDARVYVLDEPTVGVDIAAKVEIYRLIGRLAEAGAAILVLSSDLDELIGIADRVLVMYRGRIVSDLPSAGLDAPTLIGAVLTGTATPDAAPQRRPPSRSIRPMSNTDAVLRAPPGLGRTAPPSRPRAGGRLLQSALRTGSLALFAAIVLFFAVRAPFFLSVGNFGAILAQSAILGVLGFGLTLVLIGGGTDVVKGGIDLSLAANLGLSAAVYAVTAQTATSEVVPVVAALGTGLAIGAVNALSIVGFGILPLLATLAVMNVCAGLELVVTENVAIHPRHQRGDRLPRRQRPARRSRARLRAPRRLPCSRSACRAPRSVSGSPRSAAIASAKAAAFPCAVMWRSPIF